MTTPGIEKLKLHNKNIMNKSIRYINDRDMDEYRSVYYRAKGWYDALNYITNNYKLEEK